MDFPRDDGLTRRVEFSDGRIAVLDVSSTVTTVNWTTPLPASKFVVAMNRLRILNDGQAAYLHLKSEPGELEFDAFGLVGFIGSGGFDDDCQFLRLDTSSTQSLAWERLPIDGELVVAGLGDDTRELVQPPATQRLRGVLDATVKDGFDVNGLIETMYELVNRFPPTGATGSGSRR